jgi:hypothetical protein
MSVYYVATKLVLNASLTVAVAPSQGFGNLLVVGPDGATPLNPKYTTVASAADAAALLTAGNIDADTNRQLQAAYSQGLNPGTIVVATYPNGEGPADAIGRVEAAGIPYGIVTLGNAGDTAVQALGTWNATGANRWLHPIVVESSNAGLLTSGKPAALDDCELETARMLLSASNLGMAGAFAGRVTALGWLLGPVAAEQRLLGVSLPAITSAEFAFANANDVGVLLPLDVGSGASERVVRGVDGYGGVSWKAATTVGYAVKRVRDAMVSLFARKAIQGRPLEANSVGVSEVEGTIGAVLMDMYNADHFTPGPVGVAPQEVSLPEGFRIDTVIASPNLAVTLTLRVAQEVNIVTINFEGEVV